MLDVYFVLIYFLACHCEHNIFPRYSMRSGKKCRNRRGAFVKFPYILSYKKIFLTKSKSEKIECLFAPPQRGYEKTNLIRKLCCKFGGKFVENFQSMKSLLMTCRDSPQMIIYFTSFLRFHITLCVAKQLNCSPFLFEVLLYSP